MTVILDTVLRLFTPCDDCIAIAYTLPSQVQLSNVCRQFMAHITSRLSFQPSQQTFPNGLSNASGLGDGSCFCCIPAQPKLGKNVGVLSLIIVAEASTDEGAMRVWRGPFEHKMAVIKEISRVFWIVWHRCEAWQGCKGGACPFPPPLFQVL